MQLSPFFVSVLPNRAVLRVSGPDRVSFLQGLLSNDVTGLGPNRAVWAALLTPQGRWLADFFLYQGDETILLDGEVSSLPDIAQKLHRFKLRADVTIADSAASVYALWGDGLPALPSDAIAAPDPRWPAAGWRCLYDGQIPVNATAQAYDAHRLDLGLPDGARDLIVDKSLLMESGFDRLNGISWTKGCYMGQEVTARMRYRGLVKRRLYKVTGDRLLPPPGTAITGPAGEEAGEMRSAQGTVGLAMLRLSMIDRVLSGDDVTITPHAAPWDEDQVTN